MATLATAEQTSLVIDAADPVRLAASLVAHVSYVGDVRNNGLIGGLPSDPMRTIEGFSIEVDQESPYQLEYMIITLDGELSGWVKPGVFVGSRSKNGKIRAFGARIVGRHEPPLECLCVGRFAGSDALVEGIDDNLCESPDGTPLIAMQIVIREATTYKGRALPDRAVVFGHSHARILWDAQFQPLDLPVALKCGFVEMAGKYIPFSTVENGVETYHAEFMFDLEAAVAAHRPAILLAMFSGLEIMYTVGAYGLKPFDILLDGGDMPYPCVLPPAPLPGHELIPARAIYLSYEEVMRPWIRALPLFHRRFGLPVIMLCPPPPISDNEAYIRHMPEEIRQDMLRSMPPPGMRYRAWIIWWRVVKNLCAEYGIHFLSPPSETIDPKDGGLAAPYHGDGLHANHLYGAAQIRLVEAFLRGDHFPAEARPAAKIISKSANPYASLPDENFWRQSISNRPMNAVDPVVRGKFQITPQDRIATAGSCFAQHIAKHLKHSGFTYYVSETHHPVLPHHVAEQMGYGMFTARYGNVYTARQWRQLLERAYGAFHPLDDVWPHKGGFVDAFRPRIEMQPFALEAEVKQVRERHFEAVRDAVETADYFVFTLGLTEAWVSKLDGAVYPICPGVAGGVFDDTRYEFRNFSVSEVVADLQAVYAILHARNPKTRIILTVSPVPLVATYEPRSVLTSTICSKSILRAAADEMERAYPEAVAYFPSYEIITGPHAGNLYFEADRREVTQAGVDHVMRLFMRHFTRWVVKDEVPSGSLPTTPSPPSPTSSSASRPVTMDDVKRQVAVICDEEVMDQARNAMLSGDD